MIAVGLVKAIFSKKLESRRIKCLDESLKDIQRKIMITQNSAESGKKTDKDIDENSDRNKQMR